MTGHVIDLNLARRQSDLPRNGVDADDLRNRLRANAQSFVEWLYSGRAYINRGEARIGNVNGEPGASLSICLTGQDAGLWKDHATDEGGDLIDLYRAWAGYSDKANFAISLKEIAKDFFRDPIEIERAPWQPTPLKRIEEQKAKLGTKPRQDMTELGAPVATYRYYDTHGNIIASVVRFEPDGTREGKTFRPFCFRTVDGVTKWIPGAPDLRPLYRLPEISISQTVVLCEGEGKADALGKLGIAATSAMQGAKAPLDKTDWSPLAGKTVVVWPDNDEPGFSYAKSVSERLVTIGCRVLCITPPDGVRPKWDAADCVAEGRDPHVIISSAKPFNSEPSSNGFRLYTLDELANLKPPSWLIDGVVVDGGLSLFWAGSDSYKTFVAIDMAASVATGGNWHGRSVSQGPVVYVAAEDDSGVVMRMLGWRATKGRDLPPMDLTIMRDGMALASQDADKLIDAIKGLPTQPKLIVIDTLAATFGAGNEDKTNDMNAYVVSANKLRRATGAGVIIIHHTGRNTEQERGNVALRAGCDTIFTVKRIGTSGKIKLINKPPKGKQKNASPFEDIHLRMQQVAFDHLGVERTTLVVMSDDDAPAAGEPLEDEETEDTARRLGQIEKSIMAALEKAARSDRQHLGFVSLYGMVGGHKGAFGRALRCLIESKKLVREFSDENDPDGKRKLYARI